MKIELGTRLRLPSILAVAVVFLVPGQALASDECDLKVIADKVKTIAILRQVENSLNVLALAQVDAIVDIATGVHTLELYNTDAFFGPLGGLRKLTDKNETFINGLDKSIRRLDIFDGIESRYTDIRESTAQIVTAGYDVLRRLEADDTRAATQIYASRTVVALNDARADTYSTMAEFERSISLAALRCR